MRSIQCRSQASIIFAIYFVQLQNINSAKVNFQYFFNKPLESSRIISPINWLKNTDVSGLISASIVRFWSDKRQSLSKVTTGGQPVSVSWYWVPFCGSWPDFCLVRTVTVLSLHDVLCDDRTGLSVFRSQCHCQLYCQDRSRLTDC
jgi:hypothetical protein